MWSCDLERGWGWEKRECVRPRRVRSRDRLCSSVDNRIPCLCEYIGVHIIAHARLPRPIMRMRLD